MGYLQPTAGIRFLYPPRLQQMRKKKKKGRTDFGIRNLRAPNKSFLQDGFLMAEKGRWGTFD